MGCFDFFSLFMKSIKASKPGSSIQKGGLPRNRPREDHAPEYFITASNVTEGRQLTQDAKTRPIRITSSEGSHRSRLHRHKAQISLSSLG